MFEDVISKGWFRIHIVLSIVASPLFIMIFLSVIDATVNHMDEEAVWISIFCSPLYYWLFLFIVVWIKRGFKQS